jgi:outer membrane receptor protein involved in Fe transport
MKKIIILLLGIAMCTNAFAHQGAVSIKAIDAATHNPIDNASICIKGFTDTMHTDISGNTRINGLNAGTYVVVVNHLDFLSDTQTVVVKDYETIKVLFFLRSKPIAIPEISVSKNARQNTNAINAIHLQRMPINTSQDILRAVPGLFTAQHAGGGKAEQIFLRGFDCDHGTDITLSVDGMPVNKVSHAHGQGYADLHFLIPEMVERLDISKGSYDVKYGDFSTAGAIAFTTKSRLERNSIQLEKGMYNNNRVLAMLNILKPKDNRNWIAAAEYNFNKGYFESPMNLNRLNLMTKYSAAINEKHRVNLQASYFNSFWNASGQIPERLVANNTISPFGSVDPTEGGQTSRTNISATLSSFLKNGAMLRNQFFINQYNFNLYSNFTFYKNDPINGDMIQQKEARTIYGYNGSIEKSQLVQGLRLKTKAGLQVRYDNILGSELSNVKQRYTFVKAISLGDIKQLNTSAYINEQVDFNKKLSLQLGTRYDNFYFNYHNKLNNQTESVVKSIWSPKFNLSYLANDRTEFFIKAGKGFHSNDARVVTAQRGVQVLPSSIGSDIGAIFKANKNLLVTAALWQLDLEQEFVYVGDEAVVEASGATRRLGIDLAARYQITKHLAADLDCNYAHARLKATPSESNRIPLAPIFTSIGGLAYNTKRWDASVRYRHLGKRAANEMNTIVADGYTLLDAVANYRYKQFTFGFSAENLLNAQWKEAQFETETQLQNEAVPVSEIHYTSGTPLNVRFKVGYGF